MRGQSTIEFLGGLLLFLIVLVASLTIMSDRIPQFSDDVEESSKNLEMYRISNQIMTESGKHNFSSGGSNWEKNTSTISNTQEFGLANNYHVLNKTKIDALSTRGASSFNYSQFTDLKQVRNQYRFNFVWFPTVETSGSFTRTFPPSNPPITEPSNPDYSNAENRVHYGNIEILGEEYNFLVAAFDGVYNTTYISKDNWNFSGSSPRGVGDQIALGGESFELISFQNRDRTPGSSVVFRRNLNSFGRDPSGLGGTVTKINRYAVLEANQTDSEVVRMEVLAW